MLNELHKYLLSELKKSKLIDKFHDLSDETYKALAGAAPADFPRLHVSLISLTGPLAASSSSFKFVLVYDVKIDTSDETQKQINSMVWELVCRVCWMQDNKGIFEYQGERPIKDIELMEVPIGLFVNSTVPGFGTVSKIRFTIHVSKNLVSSSECGCNFSS